MSNKIICPLILACTKTLKYCEPDCALRVKAIDGVNTYSMCAITALAVTHADRIVPVNYEHREERIR